MKNDILNDTEFPRKSEINGSLDRKRRSIEIENRNLNRMNRATQYPSSAMAVDKNGDYAFDKDAVRLKRIYRGKRSKYLKKTCNRKLRRTNLKYHAVKRGSYRKLTEFWWEYS